MILLFKEKVTELIFYLNFFFTCVSVNNSTEEKILDLTQHLDRSWPELKFFYKSGPWGKANIVVTVYYVNCRGA